MKAVISESNPFGWTRYGYLYHTLQQNQPGWHLDYGCYDGAVLRTLVEHNVVAGGVGVDLNRDAINSAKTAMTSDRLQFLHIRRDETIPAPDSSTMLFDSASLLDVVEHVADQEKLLGRVRDVLKPGGRLIVTVPGKHIFSFLDLGNYKFVFPRLHRWVYVAAHSRSDYDYRYVNNPHGLIGDVEKEKGWHQHFAAAELRSLLERCNFDVVDVDGAGLFYRPLVIAAQLRLPTRNLLELDMRAFDRANLFMTAIKRDRR